MNKRNHPNFLLPGIAIILLIIIISHPNYFLITRQSSSIAFAANPAVCTCLLAGAVPNLLKEGFDFTGFLERVIPGEQLSPAKIAEIKEELDKLLKSGEITQETFNNVLEIIKEGRFNPRYVAEDFVMTKKEMQAMIDELESLSKKPGMTFEQWKEHLWGLFKKNNPAAKQEISRRYLTTLREDGVKAAEIEISQFMRNQFNEIQKLYKRVYWSFYIENIGSFNRQFANADKFIDNTLSQMLQVGALNESLRPFQEELKRIKAMPQASVAERLEKFRRINQLTDDVIKSVFPFLERFRMPTILGSRSIQAREIGIYLSYFERYFPKEYKQYLSQFNNLLLRQAARGDYIDLADEMRRSIVGRNMIRTKIAVDLPISEFKPGILQSLAKRLRTLKKLTLSVGCFLTLNAVSGYLEASQFQAPPSTEGEGLQELKPKHKPEQLPRIE